MNQDTRAFLAIFSKSKPAYRKKLLQGAPNEIIDLLSICAMNILRGEIILTKNDIQKLRPYKNNLRNLADKKISTKRKRIILQKGGFINVLKIVPTMLKGFTHGLNTGFKLIPGTPKPLTDMEMRDNDAMLDNMIGNSVKFHQIGKERDRKRADGTYEIMDAIRNNPAPLVQAYRDMKKQGKI